MNIMQYEKEKTKQLSAYQLSNKLFHITGQINYCLFSLALKGPQKDLEWTSTESKEL